MPPPAGAHGSNNATEEKCFGWWSAAAAGAHPDGIPHWNGGRNDVLLVLITALEVRWELRPVPGVLQMRAWGPGTQRP